MGGKRIGLKVTDFENINKYYLAVDAYKAYQENKKIRDFHNEQVNGTIFAHEGSEGEIL